MNRDLGSSRRGRREQCVASIRAGLHTKVTTEQRLGEGKGAMGEEGFQAESSSSCKSPEA